MLWWQDRERLRALVSAPARWCVQRWSAWRPIRRQAAQSLVEVCLLLAFVAIILVGILSITGKTVSCSLEPLDNGLAAGQTSPGNSGNTPGNSGNAPGQNKACGSKGADGNGPPSSPPGNPSPPGQNK